MSQIPINLSKYSLRVRLEAYYSLIDPDRLRNRTKWRKTCDEIYEKYGGTCAGERKLSSKLARKYGFRVKLLLADGKHKKKAASTVTRFDESWFEVPEERTGVISFCSNEFDPFSLLNASETKVRESNSFLDAHSIQCLDNTQQFAQFLPFEDPLHCRGLGADKVSTVQKRSPPRRMKSFHPFVQIARSLQPGPFAVLQNLHQQRVCVITRYVNAIRGSLTGTLIAFDKHLNLVLLDVEETYTCRPTGSGTTTNIQIEVERRRKISESESPSIFTAVKRRRMKQIMIRGDGVVSLYKDPQRMRRP